MSALRRSAAPSVDLEPLPPGVRIELVFNDVRNPVAMAFAPDGRWFFTERTTGWVQMVTGANRGGVFHAPAVGGLQDERGLLGITLDPNFGANGHIYIFYTGSPGGSVIENYVERFTLQGSVGVSATRLLTVPLESSTLIHNGGNLHFGPDGKLYVSIGDYFNDANGQNLNKMPAKIHRFNSTAPLSAPSDNPFFANPNVAAKSTYAYGFRNPFDFDFDPVSGAMHISTDLAESTQRLATVVVNGRAVYLPIVFRAFAP